jgi:hypothetical protein
MRKPYLKAVKIGDKARVDAMGISYRIDGMPSVFVHASVCRAGHRGSRRAVTMYLATANGAKIASATTLNTLLVRVEQAGFAGFMVSLGAAR